MNIAHACTAHLVHESNELVVDVENHITSTQKQNNRDVNYMKDKNGHLKKDMESNMQTIDDQFGITEFEIIDMYNRTMLAIEEREHLPCKPPLNHANAANLANALEVEPETDD
jgi:hypothetical protein